MKLFRRSRQTSTVLDLRQATSGRRPTRSAPRTVSVKWLYGLVSLVIVIPALTISCYLYFKAATLKGKDAMRRSVDAVSQLMLLPAGETPTYGTVTDKNKLKNQTFFRKAENGDEVLIYEKAKVTILYRPSIHKIVNVGPLVVGSSGSPYVTSRFAIKNGTDKPELETKMAAQIKQAYPNARITSIEKASRSYPTTITIDLTKKNQPLDEQIADSLHIQPGKVPLGEPTPETDFLIIIGQDYEGKS